MSLTVEVQAVPLEADQDGVMRVGKTRVTLDTVVHAFEQGHTPEEIVSHYPALRLADVYAVIAYYLNNKAEVQAYLGQRQAEAQKIREQIESKADYQTLASLHSQNLLGDLLVHLLKAVLAFGPFDESRNCDTQAFRCSCSVRHKTPFLSSALYSTLIP